MNNYFYHFVQNLDKLKNLPTIIQGIGIALLTILIPLSIAIISDVYQKRRNKLNNNYTELDIHVILDYVFKIKYIILSVFMIFFPMLFWEILISLHRYFAFLISVGGIYILTRVLYDIYRWIKGGNYLFKYRYSYLSSMRPCNELKETWSSVWCVKHIESNREKIFLDIFITKVNYLIKNSEKNQKIISNLLNDFLKNINYRSIELILDSKLIFKSILEWHYHNWKLEYQYVSKFRDDKNNKKTVKKIADYGGISRTLNSILERIEEKSLRENASYHFLIQFKEHTQRYKDEYIAGNKTRYSYLPEILNIFYRIFLREIVCGNIPNKNDIWEKHFPPKWKITMSNLDKKEKYHVFAELSWNFYLEWFKEKTSEISARDYCNTAEVSDYLIPEANPSLWGDLLFLIFSSSSKFEDGIKQTIERYMRLNTYSRTRLISNVIDMEEANKRELELIQKEKEKTYELLSHLFKKNQYFSKQNIKKYIEKLEKINYSEDLKNEKNRKELLSIFKEMLLYKNKKTNSWLKV